VILVRKYSIRQAHCDHPKNKKDTEDLPKVFMTSARRQQFPVYYRNLRSLNTTHIRRKMKKEWGGGSYFLYHTSQARPKKYDLKKIKNISMVPEGKAAVPGMIC
jgi:hypothetical protein